MLFFRRRKERTRLKHLIESLMVGTALILFWRGAWGLLDLYLFPNNQMLSSAVSVGLGLFILFIDDLELNEINSRR